MAPADLSLGQVHVIVHEDTLLGCIIADDPEPTVHARHEAMCTPACCFQQTLHSTDWSRSHAITPAPHQTPEHE